MKKGFTILELLIVMILIAFLISISFVVFNDADDAKKKIYVETTLNNLVRGTQDYVKDTQRRPLDISALLGSSTLLPDNTNLCTDTVNGTTCSMCNDLNDDRSTWNGPYLSLEGLVLPFNVNGCTNIDSSFYMEQQDNINNVNGTVNSNISGNANNIVAWDLTIPNAITTISRDNDGNGGSFLVFPEMVENDDPNIDYNYQTMNDPEMFIALTKARLLHFGDKCMITAIVGALQDEAYAKIIMQLENGRDDSETLPTDFDRTTSGYYYTDIHPDSVYWYTAIPIVETSCDY